MYLKLCYSFQKAFLVIVLPDYTLYDKSHFVVELITSRISENGR